MVKFFFYWKLCFFWLTTHIFLSSFFLMSLAWMTQTAKLVTLIIAIHLSGSNLHLTLAHTHARTHGRTDANVLFFVADLPIITWAYNAQGRLRAQLQHPHMPHLGEQYVKWLTLQFYAEFCDREGKKECIGGKMGFLFFSFFLSSQWQL